MRAAACCVVPIVPADNSVDSEVSLTRFTQSSTEVSPQDFSSTSILLEMIASATSTRFSSPSSASVVLPTAFRA